MNQFVFQITVMLLRDPDTQYILLNDQHSINITFKQSFISTNAANVLDICKFTMARPSNAA